MRLVPHPAEVFGFNMGIDLGGGDPFMSEHFLNGTEVGTPGQEMGRKRVAQNVRRDRTGDTGLFGVMLKMIPNITSSGWIAMNREEKWFTNCGEFGSTQGKVGLQGAARSRSIS